jgi:hypothetical protein
VLIVDGRQLTPEPGWSVGDLNFTRDGAHWWYRSMLIDPPEAPPSQSDPARIALVLDGEHHRLGLDAERIEQLVSLQGGLFGVVTED